VAAAAICLPGVARADPSSTVTIDASPEDPIARQIEAELRTLGFSIKVVDAGSAAGEPWRELRTIARASEAVAAIRVESQHQQVELWVADRATGKVVQRTIQVDDPASPQSRRTVAIRVVELLRVSLQELDLPGRPPEAEVEASSVPIQKLKEPRPPRFMLDLSPAVMGSPGGIVPSLNVLLGFRWMAHPHVGLALVGIVPTFASRLEAEEGVARIAIGAVGGGPVVPLVAPSARWQPELGAAAVALFLRMEGEAREPYESNLDLVTTAGLLGRVGLGVAIHRRLRLRLDAMAGVAIPTPMVRFADRNVASWGRPLLLGAFGLEAVLP
jgi:hypothetical protein